MTTSDTHTDVDVRHGASVSRRGVGCYRRVAGCAAQGPCRSQVSSSTLPLLQSSFALLCLPVNFFFLNTFILSLACSLEFIALDYGSVLRTKELEVRFEISEAHWVLLWMPLKGKWIYQE